MKLEKKISRRCKAAAVARYIRNPATDRLVLLAPSQPLPTGQSVQLTIDQN